MSGHFPEFSLRKAGLFHRVALSLLLVLVGLPFYVKAQEATNEELRTIAAVRDLTVEQASEHRRVRLQGVVTFYEENFFSRYLQDDTAGIYLSDAGLPVMHLLPGEFVEVTGFTAPGEYAPSVVPQSITVLGRTSLPEPKVVTYDQLASGIDDSQFVEITGTVRSVEQLQDASKLYLMEIATGAGRLTVYAPALPVAQIQNMVDSTVRLRGVCATKFNRQRQLFAVRLMVPLSEDLTIESPAPQAPFAAPVRTIGSILQFNPEESYDHRIKVAGTVIYFEPGKTLFIQDGDHGVEVQTKESDPLALGDRIEALGFVGQGDYTPAMQDAIYRKISDGPPLQPVPLTPDQALMGTNDCQLVQLTGTLLDRAVGRTEKYLVVQKDGFIFHVYFNQSEKADPFTGLQNGSRISVTGICRIDPGEWLAGETWRAKSFWIELQSIKDVSVLAVPSWWTLSRVLWIVVIMSVVALVAFGWVAVLRRQVAERGRQLEIQIRERQVAEHRGEIEQERTRVAQDLHDELGATLTELGMLGTLAKTPALPSADREVYLDKVINTSRTLVATLDEIVWAVNPKYDSVASLVSYYSLFTQRFLNLAGITCRLKVAETFPPVVLDSRLRHGIFLAFKEALNNAVRHSGASRVLIEMDVVENELKIAVVDDGHGFDPVELTSGSDGLANMKERMSKVGGSCKITSRQGNGTTVEFSLPLE
ncbi:MAG TPA: ATP-binding protein [Candidatus Acidoferrales bacterium]|jgi:signal transduction histidine kinase|nr:ATP-binding protein [Candidatus Acidoferrales bacterium]